MTINSTPHKIDGVFGVRYHIDFYQRDYKWTQSQVEILLSDIFFKFEMDYKASMDATVDNISKYGWYYLNTFVTNEENGRKFIVDGQQRLTTLTLIIIKLYHLARSQGMGQVDWLKSKVYGAHAEGKTYWMGAEGRAEALEILFTADANHPSDDLQSVPLSIRNIYGNYDFISNYLDKRLTDDHKLSAFIFYFMLRIQLVELHISDSRDVAMVFEVINDRGERLQPYEVLKGELLGQLTKQEIDQTYLRIWTNSIDPLQDIDTREPDRFFQLLFRSKHIDSRNDYRDFEGDYQREVFAAKWNDKLKLKRNPVHVKEFLSSEVHWFAHLYQELLALNKQEGTYLYFNGTLNGHDRQYLLIMSAIDVNDPDRAEKIDLVARLFDRNFSLLRLMGSYNTNRFTDSIIELNSAIRNQPISKIQEAFDRQLIKDIKTVRGVTVDDPFQWSLFRNTGYELGSRFIRYFFTRIEHFITDHVQLPVDSYWNLVRNNGRIYGYHVEHILADNEENRALFDNNDEAFILQRNRLGGLLLLKGRDNQSSSNEPYVDKLKTYSHAPILASSLRSDFFHNHPGFREFAERSELPFRPYDSFGVDEIEERQKLYFMLAKQIWGDCSFPL